MQVAPRIVVQSCPLLTIYPRCCPRHATDMPQMMLQTCPKHGWVGWDGNLCKHLFCGANNRNRRRYHRFRLKQWFKDLESKHFFYSAGLFMPLLNIYWNAKKQGKFFVVVLQGITDKAVWLCSCILSKFKDPVPLKIGINWALNCEFCSMCKDIQFVCWIKENLLSHGSLKRCNSDTYVSFSTDLS